MECKHAKSDMTPCFHKDGLSAVSDDGFCVGCNLDIGYLRKEASDKEKPTKKTIPVCTYCGKRWPENPGGRKEIPEDVLESVKEHMERCPDNPFVQKVADLQKQNDLLTLGILQEKNKIARIRKQYNEDMMHFCESKPPEIFDGYKACLSCNMRETCRAIYKPEQKRI